MEKVAASSGCVLWKDNGKIYAIRTSSESLSIVIFVFLLLTVILIANGILFTIFGATGKAESILPGLIITGAGIIFLFLSLKLIQSKRKSNNRLPEQGNCICVFDEKNKKIVDENNFEIESFSNSTLERKFQLSSSSKKLVLVCGKKEILLAKGNPFDGGIYAVEDYLMGIGIK